MRVLAARAARGCWLWWSSSQHTQRATISCSSGGRGGGAREEYLFCSLLKLKYYLNVTAYNKKLLLVNTVLQQEPGSSSYALS